MQRTAVQTYRPSTVLHDFLSFPKCSFISLSFRELLSLSWREPTVQLLLGTEILQGESLRDFFRPAHCQ